MAPQTLTEYERRRLENIKRNEEMMASLKIPQGFNELSSATKRQRMEMKGSKKTLGKKPKLETPIVIRRSLRSQGLPPDVLNTGSSLGDVLLSSSSVETPESPTGKLGPVSMQEACVSTPDRQRHLVDTVKCMSEKTASLSCSSKGEIGSDGRLFDLGSLVLKSENIRRVSDKILNLKFVPSTDRNVIVSGDKKGSMAFWDMDCEDGDRDGVYAYHPHRAPISGITVQPFSLSKVFTSSYDGTIRLMDVGKELFEPIYSTDYEIFCLSQRPHDATSLYFGEGQGEMNVWDERAGKSSSSWAMHNQRINTIDFNPENTNLMATSSTDGTACIWDIRNIDTHNPEALKVVDHNKAVHSAYFSPTGTCLATTSISDKVGLVRGADFTDVSMIYHDNHTGRWIPSFRAIWGWDDSYIFIGNMKRGVDVLPTDYRKMVTMQSELLSAIPCRFAAHPFKVGMLAGATAGGQIYTWTSTQEI